MVFLVFDCIVVKHGLVEGPSDWDRGTWPSILRAECTTWASWSPSAIRSTDERDSLLDFRRKIWVASARKPDIRLSSGVPCARFLVCPIINNTITKTVFSVAFFHCTLSVVKFVVNCVVKLKHCQIGTQIDVVVDINSLIMVVVCDSRLW